MHAVVVEMLPLHAAAAANAVMDVEKFLSR